jgi:alpha-1,6-mannosyltransferase
MWAGFLAYCALLALAPHIGGRAVWGLILAAVVVFAACPPLLSHDVYSYVDYARLGAVHGLDPYVRTPSAAPLDPAFAHVTWTDTTSAYGPLFTLATYPLALLPVGAAVAVLKAVAAACVVALAALVGRVAAARGVDATRAAAFVALNPRGLVHVRGGAHNDAVAMLLTTVALVALLTAREALGGAAIVLAVAVKASTAVAAPFLLAGAARPRRLLGGALAAALVAALAAQAAFGPDWLHAFGLAGENQGRTSHMSLPIAAARLTGIDPSTMRLGALLGLGVALALLLAWVRRGGDWVRAAAWASLALLLATSWLLPWYLIWVLPLAALSRDRPLQLLTLGLTAYQLGARIPL